VSLASTKLAANRNFSRFDFDFFVEEVMSNYLTTGGLKKFFSTSGGPLRPEARGICHICHMVNPALAWTCHYRTKVGEKAEGRRSTNNKQRALGGPTTPRLLLNQLIINLTYFDEH